MKCPKCGKELKIGEKFCESCGAETEYKDLPLGTLTFKRDNNFFGCAIPFKVFVNGEQKGSLSSGGTLTFEYPYGEYEISLNKKDDKKSKRTITINEEHKNIKVNVGVRMFAISFTAKGKIKSVE